MGAARYLQLRLGTKSTKRPQNQTTTKTTTDHTTRPQRKHEINHKSITNRPQNQPQHRPQHRPQNQPTKSSTTHHLTKHDPDCKNRHDGIFSRESPETLLLQYPNIAIYFGFKILFYNRRLVPQSSSARAVPQTCSLVGVQAAAPSGSCQLYLSKAGLLACVVSAR